MQIVSLADALAPQVIDLAKRLASIPSPTGFEADKAKFIQGWLWDQCRLESELDEAGNIVVIQKGEPGNSTQLFLAHIDTVFGGLKTIVPRTEGNCICAPSIGDNSCNVAALMLVLKAQLQSGRLPAENRIIAFNVGEEGLGNLNGVRALMNRFAGQIEEVIAIDATSDAVIARAVGSVRYRVAVKTCGGHSYSAFGNPSAVFHAANLITRLYGMEVPSVPKTTYNVGTVEGGTSVNAIAQSCSMLIDLRSEDAQCLQALNDKALEIIEAERSASVDMEVTLLGQRPCGKAIADTSLVDRIKAVRATVGLPENSTSGSTDCNIPLSMGIPSVCFGVYLGQGSHTTEECIYADSISKGLQQLLCFFFDSPPC